LDSARDDFLLLARQPWPADQSATRNSRVRSARLVRAGGLRRATPGTHQSAEVLEPGAGSTGTRVPQADPGLFAPAVVVVGLPIAAADGLTQVDADLRGKRSANAARRSVRDTPCITELVCAALPDRRQRAARLADDSLLRVGARAAGLFVATRAAARCAEQRNRREQTNHYEREFAFHSTTLPGAAGHRPIAQYLGPPVRSGLSTHQSGLGPFSVS
jgi:hypothetical protein